MAESVALAVLENLVHMSRQDFPSGYVVVSAVVPDDIKILSLDDIQGARSEKPQRLGDMWLHDGTCAVLRVPSVIVPSEFNYLLNPRHQDFARIVAGVPFPFTFDERLFGTI
jgi:RES domain-containing protein